MIGSQFGATADLDAYFAAFRIPDAIFQLVVAGALSAALIPVFSSYRAREDEKEAWRLASSVINLVLVALAVFSAIMAILAPVGGADHRPGLRRADDRASPCASHGSCCSARSSSGWARS